MPSVFFGDTVEIYDLIHWRRQKFFQIGAKPRSRRERQLSVFFLTFKLTGHLILGLMGFCITRDYGIIIFQIPKEDLSQASPLRMPVILFVDPGKRDVGSTLVTHRQD